MKVVGGGHADVVSQGDVVAMHPIGGVRVAGAGDAKAAFLGFGQLLDLDDLAVFVPRNGQLIGQNLVQDSQPGPDDLLFFLDPFAFCVQAGLHQLSTTDDRYHCLVQPLLLFLWVQAILFGLIFAPKEGFLLQLAFYLSQTCARGLAQSGQQSLTGVAQQVSQAFARRIGVHGIGVAHLGFVALVGKVLLDLVQDSIENRSGVMAVDPQLEAFQGRVVWPCLEQA